MGREREDCFFIGRNGTVEDQKLSKNNVPLLVERWSTVMELLYSFDGILTRECDIYWEPGKRA
jgi:hypothetical protein